MIFGLPPTSDWRWFVHLTRLYAGLVHSRTHFAEASYGDGEWRCILGYEGFTARRQEYNPALRADLIRTLMKPTGQWCCYWGSESKGGEAGRLRRECDEWLREHRPPVVWLARRALPAANCHGMLWPVFQACRNRRVLLVGPKHFERLGDGVVGKHLHLPVHGQAAWREVEATCRDLGKIVEDGDADLVLFSAGMAAPVMVHQLWGEYHKRATFWDVGAVLDPYCGVYERKNYRLPEWQRDVMPLNVPGNQE